MLRINGMTEKDVKLVDFPYPDDWYDDPEMLTPMVNPSWWQLKRDHKHDLAFRPLETALLEGTVDAIYTQSNVFQHIQEATGEMAVIEDLSSTLTGGCKWPTSPQSSPAPTSWPRSTRNLWLRS